MKTEIIAGLLSAAILTGENAELANLREPEVHVEREAPRQLSDLNYRIVSEATTSDLSNVKFLIQ